MTNEEKYKQLLSGSRNTIVYPNPTFKPQDTGSSTPFRGRDPQKNTTAINIGGRMVALSPNNPYRINLQNAREEDQAALYELAVKWEAENQATQDERAYARETLEEQRAYDDPLAQTNRLRRAGINPDLSGSGSSGSLSSGSGSSIGLSAPTIDQQQNSTPFGSYYADEALELQKKSLGIQKASTIIGSVISFAGTLGSMIDTFTTLPARRAAAEAGADIAKTQADIASATKDSAISAGNLLGSMSSAQLIGLTNNNIASSLSNLRNVASLFTPETSDDDMNSMLSTLGYDADSIGNLRSAIRQYHSNPAFENFYNEALLASRTSKAKTGVYTGKVLSDMIALQQEVELYELQADAHYGNLRNNIAMILDEDTSYAEGEAQRLRLGQAVDISQKSQQLQIIEHDVKAFTNQVQNISDSINNLKKENERLIKQANQFGYSDEIRAILDKNNVSIATLYGLGSNQFSQYQSILNEAIMRSYTSRAMLTKFGDPIPFQSWSPEATFMRYTFNSIVDGGVSLSEVNNSAVSAFKLLF